MNYLLQSLGFLDKGEPEKWGYRAESWKTGNTAFRACIKYQNNNNKHIILSSLDCWEMDPDHPWMKCLPECSTIMGKDGQRYLLGLGDTLQKRYEIP